MSNTTKRLSAKFDTAGAKTFSLNLALLKESLQPAQARDAMKAFLENKEAFADQLTALKSLECVSRTVENWKE